MLVRRDRRGPNSEYEKATREGRCKGSKEIAGTSDTLRSCTNDPSCRATRRPQSGETLRSDRGSGEGDEAGNGVSGNAESAGRIFAVTVSLLSIVLLSLLRCRNALDTSELRDPSHSASHFALSHRIALRDLDPARSATSQCNFQSLSTFSTPGDSGPLLSAFSTLLSTSLHLKKRSAASRRRVESVSDDLSKAVRSSSGELGRMDDA